MLISLLFVKTVHNAKEYCRGSGRRVLRPVRGKDALKLGHLATTESAYDRLWKRNLSVLGALEGPGRLTLSVVYTALDMIECYGSTTPTTRFLFRFYVIGCLD